MTADKIVWNDFEHRVLCDGPKGKIHDYKDIGGRAMQEQLPRTYFVTPSPAGVRLAHIKIGIAVKNSNLNSIGEMAERLKARPC